MEHGKELVAFHKPKTGGWDSSFSAPLFSSGLAKGTEALLMVSRRLKMLMLIIAAVVAVSQLTGVVRQVKPIIGPFHAILKLEMNYVVGGVVSHRNVVNVHIFVSEYWF